MYGKDPHLNLHLQDEMVILSSFLFPFYIFVQFDYELEENIIYYLKAIARNLGI